jgi:hypothetical protein
MLSYLVLPAHYNYCKFVRNGGKVGYDTPTKVSSNTSYYYHLINYSSISFVA